MAFLWKSNERGQVAKEQAAQRLDCFLSVVYLFPNCIDSKDIDLMSQREDELSKIYAFSGRGFFAAYALAGLSSVLMKGRLPYFR